ncbi:MAG: hypothetical protein GY711_28960 [bacterium]|nr:hypothetical protein [bacterium]
MERRLSKNAALAAIRDLLSAEPEIAAETSILDVDEVEEAAMPEPYRRLLCHTGDMTNVLQEFVGEEIHIRPLHVEQGAETVERRVLLTGAGERTVEFGSIRIHLAQFDADARADILACKIPLGAILKRHAVAFRCRPRLFFRLRGSTFLRDAFGVDADTTLYGRVNDMESEHGAALAEVVEVLPPLD